MVRIYDLRQKEIINVKDGTRFGFVADIEIDEKSGEITKIIVPGPARVFGVFGRDSEYSIPWDSIKQVGDDIILVDVDADDCLEEL
ncbi:MAG: YlmC/YmxH family sporulation protein [Defluviitaleaceae bacterium]|nr:YlmC/YmxH family sporulation protein [Defluviitaleaceae bacterium]